MRTDKTIRLLAIIILGGFACLQALAQTPAPAAPEKRKTTVTTRINPVIVQNEDLAPQVVTILHRLNGLKVFRLLVRSHEELGAIANLDEAFKISTKVHVNVIAGLALDDGRIIAAWLPEAEAEMPPPPPAIQYVPDAPVGMTPPTPPAASVPPQPGARSMLMPGLSPMSLAANLLEPADLKVVTRDGKRVNGHYVGLDGLTGLSVITLGNISLPSLKELNEEIITVGQKLRVLGPQPAPRPEVAVKGATYVRIGETEATVMSMNRSPSGAVSRVKIKSAKLSPANIGGIAINELGETLGIIDAVEGNMATMVPMSAVRSAAKRVLERQASVPRPWLGIRGEPIGAVSLERIQGVGWEFERARELAKHSYGILLTSVVPGSPAALNHLKPGDVILSVNNEEIRNGEEFSWLLQETGPGNSVSFTVARPGKLAAEALEIKLSESPDPFFGLRTPQAYAPKIVQPGSLMAHGIECIAIKPKVAMRFGATGGLLVVYVQPSTEAFKAGLRPGDVIEAIDGRQLSGAAASGSLLKKLGASSTFTVVRNKQKLTFTISTSRK
ncbi:MAG: PDZ domain-containing protein [Acidobacteriota bacterium]|nr:PDZ domain-containing protein [Acidobacteriota bacterium]